MQTKQIVEALLFASDAPLSPADIVRADDALEETAVTSAIQELRHEYERSDHAFQIYELGGGFQVLTRPDFAPYLERFATVSRPSRLSPAALEVLAIIVYRQPIGRAEIEEIRGVGSSGVLRTLLERDLVTVVGRGEGLGRPLLYGTTERFLEHFGFRSLDDLPRPDELPVVLRGASLEDEEEDAEHFGERVGAAAADVAAGGPDPAGSDSDRPAAAEPTSRGAAEPVPPAAAEADLRRPDEEYADPARRGPEAVDGPESGGPGSPAAPEHES